MISVLFVCLGNICRSPALEASLRTLIVDNHLEDKICVDSCGFNPLFETSRADPRMAAEAMQRGIVIDTRAKSFQEEYFETFTYIFAVDKKILNRLFSLAKLKKWKEKVLLATAFSSRFRDQEIADPYQGEDKDFSLVMDIVLDAAIGIFHFLEEQL